MKKILCILIAIICLFSVAVAETDLSGMSFDDLVALQKQIVAEIMSRPEWKEVTVPAGVWKIGEDIPAGSYCITCSSMIATVTIWAGEPGDYSKLKDSKILQSGDKIGKIELKEGWQIDLSTEVIFTPPVSLGF